MCLVMLMQGLSCSCHSLSMAGIVFFADLSQSLTGLCFRIVFDSKTKTTHKLNCYCLTKRWVFSLRKYTLKAGGESMGEPVTFTVIHICFLFSKNVPFQIIILQWQNQQRIII